MSASTNRQDDGETQRPSFRRPALGHLGGFFSSTFLLAEEQSSFCLVGTFPWGLTALWRSLDARRGRASERAAAEVWVLLNASHSF